GIEISGTHQYGTFSIASNLATNMLLENGGNLLVLAGTEARDPTVDKGWSIKDLGQESATEGNSGGQYTVCGEKYAVQAVTRPAVLAGRSGKANAQVLVRLAVAGGGG
ncbi:AIDA repeat-containing protein, partial [Escherichia coli]|uniref:AIDA repeat-containing protein n=1 Tax=Escherichia coli TaxID=562 RepID=UPI001484D283